MAESLLATGVICAVKFTDQSNAPWTTGSTYLGNTQVPMGIGVLEEALFSVAVVLPAAMGEEALFRGVEYEEWKVSFGDIKANLPGDYAGGHTAGYLRWSFADRFVMVAWKLRFLPIAGMISPWR